ncbi:MAG: 5-(carboxyamino)imidazole ribonucleotide synthase [Pyrinomonadaceae bacterium MAG19_C2-C3]|nr:5-(carboxyamino)imidazole ribonucleotide synthase [Pyrinomonadaceae bacterium MAG19_C2-C3]
MKHEPTLPGAVIGVLGSGQLGRMFAMQARRLGYRVHTLSPESDTPTGQISDVEINAAYDDLDAVRAFATEVDVVTIEFENIPAATLETIAEIVPVHPSAHVLHTTQQRIREKTFLTRAGFPLTLFREVRNDTELHHAVAELGCPSVLKTAGWGYDGKGQRKINALDEAARLYAELGAGDAVLEAFIDFEREISVVAARAHDGMTVNFGVVENHHRHHILDYTLAPAELAPELERRAVEIATSVLEELKVVGVLCVEMFVTKDGKLLINELAPRPHNSGHWTLDACVTSQFEQQLRAVCGLPLGSTEKLCAAAMVNLLGDAWAGGEPDWQAVCNMPNVKLHLYGKHAAREGRKMGHLTALAPASNDAKAARRALEQARHARRLWQRSS